MAKILVVEDDKLLGLSLVDILRKEAHTVELVDDGGEGLFRLKGYVYDLVILDWDLPSMSGIEVLSEFRNGGGQTPVLFLTGKGTDQDKVQGLDTGADDYLVKPFGTKELAARVRALVRRSSQGAGKTVEVTSGDVSLNTSTMEVKVKGSTVQLLAKELALLEFFLRHPSQFFTAATLLERLWSAEAGITEETLRSHISRLRGKLDSKSGGSHIETERGLGYRFIPRD